MFEFLRKKDNAPDSESNSTAQLAEVAQPDILALNPAPSDEPDPGDSVIDARVAIPSEWDAPKVTFIGEDARIDGSISTTQDLNVAGSIGGDVNCGGALELEHGGEIRGSITTEGDATIHGLVHGNIKVDGKLIIAATGCVHGDVEARALVMEEGGELHGQCATGTPKAKPPKARPAQLVSAKSKPRPKAPADPAFLSRMFDDDDAAPPRAIASA